MLSSILLKAKFQQRRNTNLELLSIFKGYIQFNSRDMKSDSFRDSGSIQFTIESCILRCILIT